MPRSSPTVIPAPPADKAVDQSRFTVSDSDLSVLLVVEPGLDGVFRHVEGLVKFLLARGTRLHLAYSSCRSGQAMLDLAQQVRASGGELLDMRVGNRPQPRDVLALKRLTAMVRRLRPDVIHAHSSKAGALARFVSYLHQRPLCIYTPNAYYGLSKPQWLRVRFFNRIERALGTIGYTIAVSQDEADFGLNQLHVPRDRLLVIPNPVDTERFVPPTHAQRLAARARLGIPAGVTVLATIGRMCWQKDPETAYRAVAPLCAENPNLMFLHLGWGEWKEQLVDLARRLGYGSQFRLLDYVDDPRSVYHAADGLLVSSRYEAGWSLVFLEAMASNLPIITSTCPGMSDVGQAGLSHVWTFPPEAVAACEQGVRRWLASTAGARVPCNHRRVAIERFSPERCYGAIYELYGRSSARARRPA